tara:strand:+ start:5456 stop:6076 length:621 start_codon:yes stop_codon:yes gene_type:complete
MSKVILIGNGPSALESELGNKIDSNEFDKVVRFNRWKYNEDGSEYTNNYSKYVGARCDYWVINDLHLNETKIGIHKRNEYEIVFVVTPNFKVNINHQKYIESTYNNIRFIPGLNEVEINNIVNFSPKWPSTGVVAMQFFIKHFDEVYLYGFDTYDSKYNQLHYFEDENATHGKNKFKFNKSNDHTPNNEVEYINHIIKNKNVKVIK